MLKGKKVILRPIDVDKDLERCWEWINDYDIIRFLGRPFKPVTKDKERELLQNIVSDQESVVFAIDTSDDKHIGLTGLHNINHFDGTAVTGTVIGDKNYWSRGYGTDAKMLLLWYGFTVLNLRRINSRVISFNKRSLNCQLKCGYKVEGVMKKEVYKNGQYYDLMLLAIFRHNWFKLWRNYQNLKSD